MKEPAIVAGKADGFRPCTLFHEWMRQVSGQLALALVLLPVLVSGQAPVPCRGPLTVEQLLVLIQGRVAEARILQFMGQCGLSFAWTGQIERRLANAGATAAVLSAVRTASRSSSGAGFLDLGGGVRMEFIRIPAGEFVMGCSAGDWECTGDEKPAHRVRITRGFEMGKYEVTQAQWEAVMGSNPSYFRGPDRPVARVSWEDAQEFLRRLNARNDGYVYRLPTEAEWEYAARGGSAGKYYGELDEIAWYEANSDSQTQPVGRKKANGFGLHDMLGNVWEWCQDLYGGSYYESSPAEDPPGPASGQFRVVRGGSWNYGARNLRASFRDWVVPSNRYNDGVGFRCVREKRTP